MCLGGTVQVNAGQNVSIWIHSTTDNDWSISQDSSFSIVLISALEDSHASGIQVALNTVISQVVSSATSWKKIMYWKSSRAETAPGLFNTGNLNMYSFGYYLISNE